MRLGINPAHFKKGAVGERNRNIFEAFDLCVNAGFKCFDFCPDPQDDIEKITDYLSSNKVDVIQHHIPFNRYAKKDYSEYSKDILSAMERGHAVGSKIAVIHGDEFDFACMEYSKEAVLEFNYRLFYPLVEYASKNGMQVAFETVFEDMNVPRFCSDVNDLCALVDRYGTKTVGICWDTGHAKVSYKDKQPDALKIAKDRVICTHVHDNVYSKDLHMFPFLGDTNWNELMAAFKEIGYKGDFTLELVYDRLPDALAPDYIKLLHKSGEYILSL